MRVGVTGSSGFIGRSSRRWANAVTTSSVSCDRTRRSGWAKVFDGIRRAHSATTGTCVEWAASTPWTTSRAPASATAGGPRRVKSRSYDRVVTRRHCWCESSASRRVRRSSPAPRPWASTDLGATKLLDETSPPGDDVLARVCIDWEARDVAVRARRLDGRARALRTGIVMSRRGGALKRQLPLFRFGLGGPLGNGRQWISPISLRDEVRAILFLLDTRGRGPFNLVAPAAVRNRDFTRVLARQLGRPARLRAPSRALSVVLGTELVEGAVLASQRVTPGALLASGFNFESSDIESILASALC